MINIVQQELIVDIDKNSITKILSVKGDKNSRGANVSIVQNEVPLNITGMKLYFYSETKKSGVIYKEIEIVNGTEGKAFFHVPTELSHESGSYKCCIAIRNGESQLVSYNFMIAVDESAYDEDSIVASEDFSVLLRALATVDEYAKILEDATLDLETKYTVRLNAAEATADSAEAVSNTALLKAEDAVARSVAAKQTATTAVNIANDALEKSTTAMEASVTASANAANAAESARISEEKSVEAATDAAKVNSFQSQLVSKARSNNEFLLRLLIGDVKKIKLIGDSITAGAQCTGYNVPPNGRIILQNSRFNDGGTGYARESGTDWNTFPSWANLFRKYINTNYPTIDFFNAGIGGLGLGEVLSDYIYKPENKLVESDDDVIILMLGTNDRTLCTIEQFEVKLEEIVTYLKENCKTLILASTPPTISEYGGDRNDKPNWIYEGSYASGFKFGSRELNMVYQKIAKKHNLMFVNHYVKSSEYMRNTNTAFYDICSDLTHPNTLGYKVAWTNLQQELGLVGQLTEFNGTSLTKLTTIPFSDFQVYSKIPLGVSCCILLPDEGVSAGLPQGGSVLTIKPTTKTGYEGWAVQYYIRYGSAKIKYRSYKGNGVTDSWTSWGDISENPIEFINSGILDSNLSQIKKGITIGVISGADGLANNFPLGKGGMVLTYKPYDANDAYTHQIFFPYGVSRQYVRHYTGTAWSSWVTDKGLYVSQNANLVNNTTLLTDVKFQEGLNFDYISNSNIDGFPEGKSGTLITHKPPTPLLGYGFQEYKIYGKNTTYQRVWLDTSVWGAWEKTSVI